MTKFEELSEAIARKKNNSKKGNEDDSLEVEVAGTETTKKPLVSFADDETDMDLIDQLYFKPKHKPLTGEFSEKWDQL
jgi:hypothetical protein